MTEEPIPQRPRSSAARPGGRRPGARPGNLHALKTGLYSKQFAALGRLFAADPKIRDALMDLNRRFELKRRRSQDVAALLFTLLFERARNIAGGDLNLDLPVDDLDSIRKSASRLSGATFENLPAPEISPKNNAKTPTEDENQLD